MPKDDRGVEYVENANENTSLPPGWALCGTCHRAWNDSVSTSVTPVPSGRCPFEYEHPEIRLEELRAAIRAENISYGELAELESLASFIEPGDVELLEWAGVPEHG